MTSLIVSVICSTAHAVIIFETLANLMCNCLELKLLLVVSIGTLAPMSKSKIS